MKNEKTPSEEVSARLGKSAIEPNVEPSQIGVAKLKHNLRKISYKVWLPSALFIFVALFWGYMSFSYQKIEINSSSFKVSSSKSQLASAIKNYYQGYKIKLVYPNRSVEDYSLAQAGLTLNSKQTISSINSSEKDLASRLIWWQPIKAKLVLNENKQTYQNFIATKTTIMIKAPVNASISLSGSNVNLASAVAGQEYGLSNSSKALLNIAENLDPQPVRLKSINVDPALTAAQLTPYKLKIEKIINQPISISIAGQTFKPSSAVVASWVEVAPTPSTVNISINSTSVDNYLNSIAGSIAHPQIAQVNTSVNGASQVLVPGQNGIAVTNIDGVGSTIAADSLSGNGVGESLSTTSSPYETISTGNYPKWIEVDITTKRLYAYQYGNLIMTYLTTDGAPLTPTVTGQYAIYAKYTSQSMYGENVDGSSYYQPNVPWVNYFYEDYAIHGNYWRPLSYFGNVNSSHGCVGLMVSDAEWIYDWAPIGTPVVVHT